MQFQTLARVTCSLVLGCIAHGAPASSEPADKPLPLRFFTNLQDSKNQTVVVYGTSLSDSAEWPKALKRYFDDEFPGRVTFVNAASSGKESNWGLANLDKRVLSQHPDLVFLEFSMNDSATKHGISQEKALANLDTMVKRLRTGNPAVELVLQVMNPVFNGNDGKASADARPDLEAYYDGYRLYAKTNGIALIDHYPAWDELRRKDPEEYKRLMPDGTHPIPEASLAVTWKNIRTFLESARAAASHLLPPPTMSNVAYGDHERQVLDFWKASSDKPTPVVLYMHGGGWMNGDKKDIAKRGVVGKYIAAGISVVSINYRYVWQARDAHVMPPVEWPMHDAKRALQFVRSKAAEWNIDPERIAASGTSAGACTSLWLDFHDDVAEPTSSDPIARESTRLLCAAVEVAQTSLDPRQMTEWTPNSRYGGHAFGFMDPKDLKTRDSRFAEFLAHREEVLPWIKEYSPYELANSADPPVYLFYNAPPALGQPQKDPTHSANFGVKLKGELDRIGVGCELVYPGAPDVKHAGVDAYLIEKLTR